jgi:hemoglobin/transferrin/lactoferrin receptor protein
MPSLPPFTPKVLLVSVSRQGPRARALRLLRASSASAALLLCLPAEARLQGQTPAAPKEPPKPGEAQAAGSAQSGGSRAGSEASSGEAPTSESIVTAPRAGRLATQSGLQAQVFSAEELYATGEHNLPRMIGKAAGIFVQETNLGGGAPILRGLIGNQILVVVDGVRLNDSSLRIGPNQYLNTIDPAIVERVEVLKGPNSVLYGSDALGGVILIWTKRRASGGPDGRPSEAPVAAELSTQFRSQTSGGYLHGGLSGVERLSAGRKLGWYAGVTGRHFDDLAIGGDEVADQTGYDGGAGFVSADLEFEPGSVLRYAARLHRDNDVPRTDRLVEGFPTAIGGPPTPPADLLNNFAVQQYWSHLLSYSDDRAGDTFDRFQARASYRGSNEQRDRIGATSANVLRVEDDQVRTLGLGLDWQVLVADTHRLTFGVDLDQDQVESSRFDTNLTTSAVTEQAGAFAPDSEFATYGAFLQDEIFAFETVDLTAGVRYTYADFSFSPFDPPVSALPNDVGGSGSFDALTASLAAGTDIDQNWRLTSSVAQGFRAPNLADLARNANFFGGIELPNPDLEPETSLTGEVGVEYQNAETKAGVGYFYTGLSDVIGRVFDPTATALLGEDAFLRVNQGHATIHGIEAQFEQRFGPRSPWTTDLVMAWTEGRQYDDTIDPGTGEQPFYDVPFRRIPPLQGTLGLEYSPAAEMLVAPADTLRLAMRWALEQDDLNPGDITDQRIDPNGTPGFAVFDFGFEGRLGRRQDLGRWRLVFENLLDHQYRIHGSGIDAPGFGVLLAMEFWF